MKSTKNDVSQQSPDNNGLTKQKPKNVDELAAEVNRDIDKLKKKSTNLDQVDTINPASKIN